MGILFFGLFIMVLMGKLAPKPPKRDEAPLAMLVEVVELEESGADFSVQSQGTVMPRTQTVLSAEVSGTIVEISPKFIAGGVFQQGEVLMRIDPTNYEVAFEKAQALVKQRQIEYDGAVKLRSQGYRAESELASAEAALASAKAELVSARRNLERSEIKLPYEGMVRSKDADLGQFVNPGTRLGVTFATDYAEVRLPLTDTDLAFVDIPDPKEVTQSGGNDGPVVTLSSIQRGKRQEWAAQIVRSEGVVDESSRVTYVVARVEDPYQLHNAGTPLPVGTFVVANVSGRSEDAMVVVPRSAVRGANTVVLLDDENLVRLRDVVIMRSDDNFAYVSSGLSAGERLVITTLENPVNGMPLRTTDDPEPTEQIDAESDGSGEESGDDEAEEQVASSAEDG